MPRRWRRKRLPSRCPLKRSGKISLRWVGLAFATASVGNAPMQKVNIRDIAEDSWVSPKGKFASIDKEISVALGRENHSTDINLRHPFDVEICRIPPGKAMCPFHLHSA